DPAMAVHGRRYGHRARHADGALSLEPRRSRVRRYLRRNGGAVFGARLQGPSAGRPMSGIYLGVDVGTGSARAGLFDAAGKRLGMGVHPIQMWKPAPDFVEQSSDDIWRACAEAVRIALAEAGARGDAVRGIGFDATCSLVLLDASDRPVTVSPSGH